MIFSGIDVVTGPHRPNFHLDPIELCLWCPDQEVESRFD